MLEYKRVAGRGPGHGTGGRPAVPACAQDRESRIGDWSHLGHRDCDEALANRHHACHLQGLSARCSSPGLLHWEVTARERLRTVRYLLIVWLRSVSSRAHTRWETFLGLYTDEFDVGIFIEAC